MIFTIGYAGRPVEEFIKILRANGIVEVVDVRRFPTSKYNEFKGEILSNLLARENISYLHIKELGGYRRPSYEEFTKTEEFARGMSKLLDEAKNKNVSVLCREWSFKGCHRRHIAEKLAELGFAVVHL